MDLSKSEPCDYFSPWLCAMLHSVLSCLRGLIALNCSANSSIIIEDMYRNGTYIYRNCVLDSFNCLPAFFLNILWNLNSKVLVVEITMTTCLSSTMFTKDFKKGERIYHFERTFISHYLYNLLKFTQQQQMLQSAKYDSATTTSFDWNIIWAKGYLNFNYSKALKS